MANKNDDKFVLFLDILGFSELVLNNTPEQLRQLYDSELHQTLGAVNFLSAAFFKKPTNVTVVAKESHSLTDVIQDDLGFHVMSDSVLIWSKDVSLNSLENITNYAAILLSMLFVLGLPCRGGLSIGKIQFIELPLNGRLQPNVVGSGVVNAHRLEAGQEWMGCAVGSECFDGFKEKELKSLTDKNKAIVGYEIPYNENAKYKMKHAINWTIFNMVIEDNIEFFYNKFSRHNKTISARTELKISNTYKFLKDML